MRPTLVSWTAEEIALDPPGTWRALHALAGMARADSGWLVGAHSLVKAGLAEPALATAGALSAPFSHELTRSNGYRAFARLWSNAMIMQSGDRHARLRAALQPGTALMRDPGFAASIEARVRQMVDALPLGRPFDVVAHLAAPLPVFVIADLLGSSPEPLLELAGEAEVLNRFLGGDDDERARPRVLIAAERLWDHFASAPADSGRLLGALRSSPLKEHEVTAQAILSFLAGHQTTADALATTCLALAQSPRFGRDLAWGRLPVERVVDEALRWDGPIQVAARTAQADVALGGVTVGRGERVLLCLGAANRDPGRYEEPESFRPDLRRKPSLAFGTGMHSCWGTLLAQLELRLATEALAAKGGLRLAAEPLRVPNLVFRRIKRMEVSFDAPRG